MIEHTGHEDEPMNIIICGAGEVGRHSAEVLASQGHNITIIDREAETLADVDEMLDVRSLEGNAVHADVLLEAGCAKADLVIAATSSDEINLLSASVAKALGAERVFARVHHSAYFERRGLDYARHLGVDHLICPEFSTAQAIASTLRSPGALVIEQFASGRLEIQQFPVSGSAKAVGQPLASLKLPASSRLAVVERQGKAFLPTGQTVIEPGDIVTLIGESDEFDSARKLFDTESGGNLKVIILGGSSQTVWVCRVLKDRGFSIRVFEDDAERAQELAEKLPWCTILDADAVNTDALKDERVDQADAFLALTLDEEQNILAAARAKSMGVKNAVALLLRPTYQHLLQHIGIDKSFSPRSTAVTEMLRLMEAGPVKRLATLAEGIAEVYELAVPIGTKKNVNQPLRELSLPANTLFAAVQREDEVFVPGGDSVIQPGDTVIAIAPEAARKALRKLFNGR
ncbi:MAG: Trk system potassium transporter TrkA [Phycisphaeraceae bacterium]